MDTNILLEKNINQGRQVISNLDAINFPVTAALWYLEESNWKLIIASPKVDQEGSLKVYQSIQKHLPTEENSISLQDIMVVSPNHSLIILLKSAIKTSPKAVVGINFMRNTISNTYIEAAHIYRMS